MTESKSFRGKKSDLLTNPTFIVSTILGTVFLILLMGGIGFLFGLAVSLILWAKGSLQKNFSYRRIVDFRKCMAEGFLSKIT
jgi:hypothetical protein